MSFTLVCYGQHSRDIEAIAQRAGKTILAIYDDDESVNALSPPDDLSGHIILGINSATARRDMDTRFKDAVGAHPLIDPSAVIGTDCHIGRGSVIGPMVSMLRSVTLGIHCHVNTGAQLVRTTVGDFTTISPGAVICGDIAIGEACTIGAGATICDRCTIGDNVFVAAGATIPPLSIVPDNELIIGVYKSATRNS